MQSLVDVREPVSSPRRIRFERRKVCPGCRSAHANVAWRGRFSDEPVRSWLAWHHYAADVGFEVGDAPIDLARCARCSLLFHRFVPDGPSLSRLYGTWIDDVQIERFEREQGGLGPSQTRFERARSMHRRLLRLHRLAGSPFPFRVLDFGCGDGVTLDVADGLGFEAWGVDPSVTRTGRARGGVRRILPSAEALQELGQPFDAVMLIEVLEHLVDPLGTLEALARLVRPGGALLVEVPDARGWRGPPRTFEALRVVQPLEHLNAFTPEVLARTCRAAGFVPAPRFAWSMRGEGPRGLASELVSSLRPVGTRQYFSRS